MPTKVRRNRRGAVAHAAMNAAQIALSVNREEAEAARGPKPLFAVSHDIASAARRLAEEEVTTPNFWEAQRTDWETACARIAALISAGSLVTLDKVLR